MLWKLSIYISFILLICSINNIQTFTYTEILTPVIIAGVIYVGYSIFISFIKIFLDVLENLIKSGF